MLIISGEVPKYLEDESSRRSSRLYLGVRASNAKNKCSPFEIKHMDSYLVSAKYPHPSVVEEDVLN